MGTQSVIEADLFEWLESYDGPRFHAVVCDPPYALISITKRFGKANSAPAQEGSDGRFSRLSSGFMGQKWDGFDSLEQYQEWVSVWAKLLIEKVLFPGAVCLFFGGTRTFQHLGVGLGRGGFEIVDTLMWLHGQGFPKSHDISKGLDKVAGAEREIEGPYIAPDGKTRTKDASITGGRFGAGEYDPTEEQIQKMLTVPATPEAETWDGYGTALKPAWEPIFLCRAPRNGKTFAQLAVEHGSGALNIGGTRLGYENGLTDDKGRWPANLVLSHSDECVKVGEFMVEGRTINRFDQGMMPFGNAAGEDYQSEQMPPETVERWACVPECPVRQLDDQVGEARSSMGGGTHRTPAENLESQTVSFGNHPVGYTAPQYFDAGGPSRFFYVGKASRGEKDKGLEQFYWQRTGDGFERIDLETWEGLERHERAHGCIHPTVKPLDICRHLATLVLPPEQEGRIRRILVPFAGSGSEIIGAAEAGWDEVVGIEYEAQYVEIAKARLRGTLGLFASIPDG